MEGEKVKRFLLSLLILSATSLCLANDLERAPQNFSYKNSQAVFIDIKTIEVSYLFDVESRKITADAQIIFNMPEQGYPVFDLVPDITKMSFAGTDLDINLLDEITDPDEQSKFRVLNLEMFASENNKLSLSFEITDRDLFDFTSNDVKIGFFMSDLATNGRGFYERYGPTNLEYDQIKFIFDIEVIGTEAEHEVFANAQMNKMGFNKWRLEYPDYFTTSSLYFHLFEKGRFIVKREEFQLKEKTIPLAIYSSTESRVNKAMKSSKEFLIELENDYGPYPHDHFVVYVTSSGGGMEYSGATMTSLRALGHEITHFWFARSLMPSRANSGWVDEAIASWRDNDLSLIHI